MRELTPEMIIALSIMVTALAGAWVSIRRKLDTVHDLVNSQYTDIKQQLAKALIERDEARRDRNDSDEDNEAGPEE